MSRGEHSITDPAPGEQSPGAGSRSSRGFLVWGALAVLLVVLVRAFIAQPYYVASTWMAPTIEVGDRVLVLKTSREPQRGDIVVVDTSASTRDRAPELSDGALGKVFSALAGALGIDLEESSVLVRVTAIGGDVVSCCDPSGRASIKASATVGSEHTFTVPAGSVFVTTEVPGNGFDSRAHIDETGNGVIPTGDIIGVVSWRVWPLSRMGSLDPATVAR